MLKKILNKLFGKEKKTIIEGGYKNKTVLIYSSGQSFVTDINGVDIEAASKNWFLIYLEYLESVGVDPLECNFTFENGQTVKVTKTEITKDGKKETKLNYRIT